MNTEKNQFKSQIVPKVWIAQKYYVLQFLFPTYELFSDEKYVL